MLKVAIIDYGMGNLFSVQKACTHLNIQTIVTQDNTTLMDADAVILPGVGAFADAMQNLKELDLVGPIKDFAASGKPFMGVCLGLQLLFEESTEFGTNKGLGLVAGDVTRFQNPGNSPKVPQIGWNTIEAGNVSWNSSPLKSNTTGEFMYFVHSYFVRPAENAAILTQTEYANTKYCSSIQINNIFATQFHPEKSGEAGLKIYENWFNHIKEKYATNP